MANHDIADMRKTYQGSQDIFDFTDLVSKEPFDQFHSWHEETQRTNGIDTANTVSLATATKDGKPSVRTVQMKEVDKRGFVFCTNHLSRKARELAENPRASLLFYWTSNSGPTISRQVRIEGTVEQVSEAESNKYFYSRPRDAQISNSISEQSSLLQSRKVLEDRYNSFVEEYRDSNINIPKPNHWGGFRVIPSRFEFWQGQTSRLHDRIVFRKLDEGETINPDFTHVGTDGWVYERLMP
uniref:pyridoxal 5'-phosphate synthase n=2 Tax=Arion vulgaris TaxID=1028688 RepID=A0A0B6ZB25_9EUPU